MGVRGEGEGRPYANNPSGNQSRHVFKRWMVGMVGGWLVPYTERADHKQAGRYKTSSINITHDALSAWKNQESIRVFFIEKPATILTWCQSPKESGRCARYRIRTFSCSNVQSMMLLQRVQINKYKLSQYVMKNNKKKLLQGGFCREVIRRGSWGPRWKNRYKNTYSSTKD